MKRFFAEPEQVTGNQIHILGSDVNHIKNVLRMKPGQEVWVSGQENREYNCVIRSVKDGEVLLDIRYIQEADYELPSKVSLFQCLPKGDKMELVIQKAVELGVHRIVPVASSRCVVKLDEKKAAKKRERWQQIAKGAAEQSKRMKIPEVLPAVSFLEALSLAKDAPVKLIPYELARDMAETSRFIRAVRPGEEVAVFIGPEGGFSPKEVEAAMGAGFAPITLGKRILRTETAGMAVLAVLMFHLEEQGF